MKSLMKLFLSLNWKQTFLAILQMKECLELQAFHWHYYM